MKVLSRRLTIASRYCVNTVIFATVTFVLLRGVGPAHGHQQTAPWLNESTLDRGLYVEVRHPRVIRKPRPFDVSVVMNNLLADGDVIVKEVRYLIPGLDEAVVHSHHHVLASKRAAYQQYKTTQQQINRFVEKRDRGAVVRLHTLSQSLLVDITAGTFKDRQGIAASLLPKAIGSTFNLTIEIDVLQTGQLRTIQQLIAIPLQPPLPRGIRGSWVAGDQHLHTAFSIDAFLLDATHEVVTDYAVVAQTIGLDWIIITDHTNVDFLFWYAPELFVVGEFMAQTFRNTNDYLVLQGQEMGVGSIGIFGEGAHLLVYPHTVDSTGFLPNPCHGLIFNHVNCEPEQVVIDRVNDNGGVGFIAHPFDSTPLSFAPWDLESDAIGWAGIEIFNSKVGVLDLQDQLSIAWWHTLLQQIEPPQNGQLAERPGFPTRFPVGLGNSDAHRPGQIGNTFTYAKLPETAYRNEPLSREDVMDAIISGRCVASNGPLVFAEINGTGTGEVAMLSTSQNVLAVTLQTTAEFGPVGDYIITVLVDGVSRVILVPGGGSGDFETTIVVEDLLAPPDKFVTIRADSADATFHAIANPIWLEFVTASNAEDGR